MPETSDQPGFLYELKRRQVFRVGAGYAVAGWLLVEIAALVLEAYEAPGWAIKAFIGLFVLGFPLALAIAWAFELTPHGIRRDRAGGRRLVSGRLFALGLVTGLFAVLAYFVVGRFIVEPAAPDRGRVSVAVLPFVSMSPDGSDEYFADGVSEELLNVLVGIDGLRVPSRTSSFAYRGSDLTLREIAAELGVEHVIEGSVRKAGDRVLITAQLVDAHDDSHLWSKTFEATLTVAELFAIQREVARAITDALKVTLADDVAGADETLPTDSVAAYDYFMLGRYHYRRQLPGDLKLSVEHFEAAVALDPGWADAWDWLAYAYNHAATQAGYLSPSEAYPKARAAALRALEIEPKLATALAILGYLRAVFDWDWVGAETDLRRALQLDPDDSGTVWSLAHVLALVGRHDEAVALTKEFAARDPAVGRRHREAAARLIDAGRMHEALETLQLAASTGADPAAVQDYAGVAYFALGQYEQAIASFRFAVEAKRRAPGTVARLAHVLARTGASEEAHALLDELHSRAADERISQFTLATAEAGLGAVDSALTRLEKAADDRDRAVLGIANNPFFSGLRQNSRLRALTERFAFPRVGGRVGVTGQDP